jgi:hypothetical protein
LDADSGAIMEMELPEFLFVEELKEIISNAESGTIINADDYVYFCISPSYEQVTFHGLYRDPYIQAFMVKNFKDNPIGYFIYFEKCPKKINVSDFGASLFFSNKKKFKEYKNVEVVFADPKFRIIGFEHKDYFAAVKWKSQNPVGGETHE